MVLHGTELNWVIMGYYGCIISPNSLSLQLQLQLEASRPPWEKHDMT